MPADTQKNATIVPGSKSVTGTLTAIAKRCLPKSFTTPPPVPQSRSSSKEKRTKNPLSLALFSWSSQLIWTASLRQIEMEDIDYVHPDREVAKKAPFFKKHLQKSLAENKSYPVLRAIFASYRTQLLTSFACEFLSQGITLSHIILYKYLILYLIDASNPVESERDHSIARGVAFLLSIVACIFISSILAAHALIRLQTVGGEIRTLLQSCLYEKSFVISTRAMQPSRTDKQSQKLGIQEAWTESDMIVLMNVDTLRMELAVGDLNMLSVCIFLFPIILGILWWFGSWPAIVIGVGTLFSFPFTLLLFNSVAKARKIVNEQTGKRINVVNDIITGIRLLKTYGWQNVYLDKIQAIRKHELWKNKYIYFIVAAIKILSAFTSRMGVLALVGIYSILYDIRDTENVVPLYAVFRIMSNIISRVPSSMLSLVNALDSYHRIESFLTAEDARRGTVGAMGEKLDKDILSISQQGILMRGAQFSWTGLRKELEDPKLVMTSKITSQAGFLGPLTMDVGKSELVAIVGPVSCGKSSLLAGIVGDMELTDGDMHVMGQPAYCPQAPWIQNASVRENITFGNEFNQELYSKVLDACCLRTDIESFPDDDQTSLGEKGITLSGGQKQRIHLARTLYRNKDVILLDDPLSAVDVHTGETIFREAIMGMCAGKCRILVTHQLQVLAQCDRVLYMDDGAIIASGTFGELMSNNIMFCEFVGACQQKEKSVAPDPDMKAAVETKYAANDANDIMEQEERATNSVTWHSYLNYVRLSGSIAVFAFDIVTLALSQVANFSVGLGIAWWSADVFGLSTAAYVGICLLLILSHNVLWFYFFVACHARFIRSSGKISEQALRNVVRAPVLFFDSTPIGRILNRFTVDVNLTDSVVPANIWQYLLSTFAILSIIGLTVSYVPLSAVVMLPWSLIALAVLQYYKSTPLEIKRLESTRASFVVTKFTEGMSGKSCIKSTGRVDDFISQMNQKIDELNSVHFQAFSCAAWVAIRQSFVSNFLVFIIGLLLLAKRTSISPGVSAIVLSNSADLLSYFKTLLTGAAALQRGMNAVERLTYYAENLPQEPSAYLAGFNTDKSWPSKGSITINAAVMRYRPTLEPAINKLTMHIAGGEKVGIVGRTGAGKSSILDILLRMVELSEGSILIDGVDISTIGLHDLRSSIAVIPQDPTLFLGTIRSNLDPEDKMDDLQLNKALEDAALGGDANGASKSGVASPALSNNSEKVEMTLDSNNCNESNDVEISKLADDAGVTSNLNDTDTMEKQPVATEVTRLGSRQALTLDSVVKSGGSNLSHGERQLMALARALARDSKIIISDEATSSVDYTTDLKIQKTLQYGLKDRTVLTIAHRLNTVMHYDKICVLDKGSVLEYDTPLALFRKQDGIFRKMCDAAMITESMLSSRGGQEE